MFSSPGSVTGSASSTEYSFSANGSRYRRRTLSEHSTDDSSSDENAGEEEHKLSDVSEEDLVRSPNKVTTEELKAALPLLKKLGLNKKECFSFSMIDINNKNISPSDVKLIAPFLRETLYITSLKLSFNKLSNQGAIIVANALQHQQTVVHLDLGFNGIGDEGASQLASTLSTNRTLRTLCLSGNMIGEIGAKSMADCLRVNSTLQVLHLTGNSLTEKGVCFLGDALLCNKALLKLFMGGAAMGQSGAASIARALEAHGTPLRSNAEEDPSVSEMTAFMNSQSISALVTGFAFDQRHEVMGGLEWLYVSQNAIGDEGVAHIAKAMTVNKGLRAIELGFNDVSAQGIETLCGSLLNYTSLMYLHLDNNTMGCHGAYHLANVLHTTKIHLLDVGFNKIDRDGIRALMAAVGTNKSLAVLVLSGNKLVMESAQAVADALEKNEALKELYMDHTDLNLLGQSYIVSGLVNNRAIGLRKLTGFSLGEVASSVHVPALVSYAQTARVEMLKENHFRRRETATLPPTCIEDCNNQLVLTYIRGMWKQHEQDTHEQAEFLDEVHSIPPTVHQSIPANQLSRAGSSGELQFGDVFEDMEQPPLNTVASVAEPPNSQNNENRAVMLELGRISTLPHSASELRELSRYFFNAYTEETSALKAFDSLELAPPSKRPRCGNQANCHIQLYPKVLTQVTVKIDLGLCCLPQTCYISLSLS